MLTDKMGVSEVKNKKRGYFLTFRFHTHMLCSLWLKMQAVNNWCIFPIVFISLFTFV